MIDVPEKRRPNRWLSPVALFMGLAIGVGVGLLVSWELWPVEYVDAAPDSLKPSHREEYIVLIGMAYAYDRDLELARSRLAGLGELAVMGSEVVTLAERHAAQGGNVEQIRALAALARELGHTRAALVAYLPGATMVATWTPQPTAIPTATQTETPTLTPTETPMPTPTLAPTETPTPTPTHTALVRETPTASPTHTATLLPEATRQRPTATPTSTATQTPRPTRTPTNTPMPEPRFKVIELRRTCEEPAGQLMVTVLDADGQPMPNVELFVRWSDGDDHFFTGLKPEIGVGYADFELRKGETYQVEAVVQSDVARGIVADACENGGRLASWRVVFRWKNVTSP
jgi:hypothetical protein